MKKIFNNTVLKLSSYKIIIILCTLLLYHFVMYVFLLHQKDYFNIVDLFINQFNYFSLFVVYSLGYLLIIYNVNQKNDFYKYYYIKFKNKVSVYNTNVLTLLIISVMFVGFIDVVAFAEGIFTLPLENLYSNYFYHTMNGTINIFFSLDNVQALTNTIPPVIYVLLINLFSIFHIFFEGLLYLVVDSFFDKDGLSLIIVIIINTFNRFLDSLGGIIQQLSFTNNIYFITSSPQDMYNYSFIIIRVLYWIILIMVVYIVGRMKSIKSDYKF